MVAPIEMPFGLSTRMDPGEPCIRWGSRSNMGRGHLEGGKGRPIVKYRDTLRSSLQKRGLGLGWNHVLDGGAEVLRDVSMATNFGTQIAVTGFV